jgi:predicted nucleic acid-binding protein
VARAVICLDTNYLILGLVRNSRESRQLLGWREAGQRLVAPALVWFEFRCGPVTAAQVDTMRAFVSEIIPFGEPQAEAAAMLFNVAARKRSTRVDAMIAGTALVANAALATNNRGDFQPFVSSGLRLV